jgi:hypothetical protein
MDGGCQCWILAFILSNLVVPMQSHVCRPINLAFFFLLLYTVFLRTSFQFHHLSAVPHIIATTHAIIIAVTTTTTSIPRHHHAITTTPLLPRRPPPPRHHHHCYHYHATPPIHPHFFGHGTATFR